MTKSERRKQLRDNYPDYHKKKLLEKDRLKYTNLTPEEKAILLEKRKEYYRLNCERIKKNNLEYYHKNKDK